MDARQRRRAALTQARLYLVCGARPRDRDPESFLHAVLEGGVDMVQLREKDADDREVLGAAEVFRRCCDEHGALLIVNDRPDLAVRAGADGVHVGQEDTPVADARQELGDDRLIGLSTHTPEQVDAAAAADVDYIAVGPVHATPTKPDAPAVGLGMVDYAANHVHLPLFAIGGIDRTGVGAVLAAGARRIAVVRAIVDADDPGAAVRVLRGVLEGTQEASLGEA